MDRDTLVRRAFKIWETGGYKIYAQDKINEWLNNENRLLADDVDYTPLTIFSVIEWASANLSSNLFLSAEWFYVKENRLLTDRLYKNLELIGWDDKVKQIIKAFFITGAFLLVRHNPKSHERVRRRVLNPEELQRLKNRDNIEILEKSKVSKVPELYKVVYKEYIHRNLIDIELIKPWRIEPSKDFKEFVRAVYLSEEDIKRYPSRRLRQLYNERKTEDEPYYLEALEYYKDNKVYLIIDNEIYYEATLPTRKPPIVYITPIQTFSPYGFTLVDILKDLQNYETALQRAFLKNVLDFADYKVLYNPTVISKSELQGRQKILRMKNPDIAPNQAIAFIQKANNIMPLTVPAIEFVKGEVENVSGFTRYNQGLQGKSLNKTATGISLLMQAGQLRLKDYLQRLILGLEKVLVNMCVYMGYDEDIILAIREENLKAVKQEELQKLLQIVQVAPQAFNPQALLKKMGYLLDVKDIDNLLASPETASLIEKGQGEENVGV